MTKLLTTVFLTSIDALVMTLACYGALEIVGVIIIIIIIIIIARYMLLTVRPSVRLSHGWTSQNG